jgi:hypothetical protein
MNSYFYIFGTLLIIVYGQNILKWRLTKLQLFLPEVKFNKVLAIINIIFVLFIFSVFTSVFISSLYWIGDITNFEITENYLFKSLISAYLVGIYQVKTFEEIKIYIHLL